MYGLPLAREGKAKIGICLILTVAFWILGWGHLAVLMLVLTLIVVNFFRDPDRRPIAEGMVCPADGEVIEVDEVFDEEHFEGRCNKVTVYMRIWNVHVNRMPLSGEVEEIREAGEEYLPADDRQAGLLNKSKTWIIRTDEGMRIVVRQIAGLVARQIVTYYGPGARIERGERIGMIQFGSRVEVYMPVEYLPTVRLGQHVLAGRDIIAQRFTKAAEPTEEGRVEHD